MLAAATEKTDTGVLWTQESCAGVESPDRRYFKRFRGKTVHALPLAMKVEMARVLS